MLRQGRDTVLRHFSWTIMLQTGKNTKKNSYSLKAFFGSHKRKRRKVFWLKNVRNRFLAAASRKKKKCKKLVQKENESNFLTWKSCQHVKVTSKKEFLKYFYPFLLDICCVFWLLNLPSQMYPWPMRPHNSSAQKWQLMVGLWNVFLIKLWPCW